MTAVVVVEDLQKSYGDNHAVQGVSFEIEEGEVFALLGPNGAGKTTTVEVLEGYRNRSGGRVEVLGLDPSTGGRRLRERIGIVLQSSGIDPYLTVAEMLRQRTHWYPHPADLEHVIGVVGLEEKRNARVKTLSGGQQRRLDLALGLIGDPDLIFLDEPTTGFDPGARRASWDTIRQLCSLGKTVLLTTHYMDEAQALADRVAVIARGRIVAAGTPDSLGGRDTAAARIHFALPPGADPASLPLAATSDAHGFLIETDQPTAVLHTLTGWAVERGLELPSLSVSRPSLEDVYLQLSGDGLSGDGHPARDAW
jgi:ABC-2 type transport system ATP-binding protein